jgi:sarcosine oxidase subunit beta
VRPLCRQLLLTSPVAVPDRLPLVVECETGFHFRRRGEGLVLAMNDPEPRWGFETLVDATVFPDRLERLARRFRPAAGATIADAWAGLYDMTADAHPIIGRVGDGVYAACGFSGHGFMQSPAVGRALAEEILTGASTSRRTGSSASRTSASSPRRSFSDYILKTPNVVSGTGALRAAARPRARTRRVSSGSMMPSSQRRAVE